jgi:hypothetical protein
MTGPFHTSALPVDDSSPFQYFAVNRDNTSLTVLPGTGEYDPEITKEIDAAIRHLPIVQKHCDDMAKLTQVQAGYNFGVLKAGGPQRYRSYVRPINREGIHEELSYAVLLKAALSMQGK